MIKKYGVFILFMFMGFLAFIAIGFLIKGVQRRKAMVQDLTQRKIEGHIISFSKEEKGFYTLFVKDKISKDTLRYYGFILHYNIQIGDSVNKEANEKNLSFYQKVNGVYIKSEEAHPY